ncbi:hypothetical protein [Archangium sp.]|uniref:hypothetical protein n=1 Tax=Archangium sp. TaxID=1872627 RepID=UPI002D5461A7|nr:hypothetical protein [Archangium sp.]HYO52474.1 hypothetical protein [Archangium sp.]
MRFQSVLILLTMLKVTGVLLPARAARADEPESTVLAGGLKSRRPLVKNPGSGATTPLGSAAQGKSTGGKPYSNQTRQQLERSKRSYEELIREHEQKLADYRKNPLSQDNKGLLKNQPPDVQQKIIEGRIKELERQLEKQRSELEKINEAIRALPSKD